MGSGWCHRSVRTARERMWIVWWLLLAALLVAVLFWDDSGMAQEVETTDTTAAAGSGSDTRDHIDGERHPTVLTVR